MPRFGGWHLLPVTARRGLTAATVLAVCLAAVVDGSRADDGAFPAELVEFGPPSATPLFAGGGPDAWDRDLRERGWIVRDGGTWHLWYTGSNRDQSPLRRLGHATSCDGLNWRRDVANPLVRDRWVEDVCVVRGAGRSPPARTRPATGQTS